MQIAICDDQKIYIDDIIAHCKKAFAGECLNFESYTFGEELLASDLESDFLFLDIEMSGIDGIDVKEFLEQKNVPTKIIFLTSHEERMIEAFGSNVIGFLHKPLQQDAFDKIVSKMKRLLNREMVAWEEAGKEYAVCAEDIRYIEAQDKYSCVATEQEKYLVRRTIKEWETILPKPDFCRVNRSYLVHLKVFDKSQNEITLEVGKTVRLSRKNKDEILAQYKEYLRKKAEEM